MPSLFPTDPLSLGNAQRLIQARNALMQLQNLLNNWLQWIYKNPTGATPQEVVANLGASAGGLFESAGAIANAIGTATGVTPAVPPAGWTVTVNADGTVTLAEVSATSNTSGGASS